MKKRYKIPYFIKDFIPPLFSLVFAIAYFSAVQKGIIPFIRGYVIAVFSLLFISRFPKVYYFRKYLIPLIAEYKRAKAQGRLLSTRKLQEIYLHLASFTYRSQMITAFIWIASIILIILIDQLFLIGTFNSALALLFTGLISATISLSLSYFVSKKEVEPLIEEIQLQLENLPDVRKNRISLKNKVILSVLTLNLIAFLAFGVLIYSNLSRVIERNILSNVGVEAEKIVADLNSFSSTKINAYISSLPTTKYLFAVLNKNNEVIASSDNEYFYKKLKRIKIDTTKKAFFESPRGLIYIEPINEELSLLVCPSPLYYSPLKALSTLKSAFYYLLSLMVLFVLYILLLGYDIGKAIEKASLLSKKISSGDLREIVPIWSDDEIGFIGENLRETFISLRKMGKDLKSAAAIVDQEVNRTVNITRTLSEEAKNQLEIASKTGRSTELVERGIQKVKESMDKVVLTTSDVSSIILQMQASVEEIAKNAEALMESVEKTVSAANEMANSSEQINYSTGILRESSQESVSFLTELDAALQETMKNASILQDMAQKVTQDAESGFSAVAAVEEEIIRTRKATSTSLEALENLKESMNRIAKIVDVIEEITEQTNLLALNASIIAAQAGEYGKSFSVVATQIRELSSRTAGQAKEIRNVIKALISGGESMSEALLKTQQVVDSSVSLSRKAGDALKTILESASMQEELSKKISIAMEEIAHGGLTATESVNKIFQMIEGITKATEEQVKTTKYLYKEAEKVREIALQLRNATQEQAKGTKVISESMIQITSDSQLSAEAVNEQAQQTFVLFTNTQELLTSSKKIELAFKELSSLTQALQQSSALLDEEMKKYKI